MEDFGYQRNSDQQGPFSDLTKRTFMVVAALFSLAAFIYITVSAYYFVYQDSNNSEVETIKSPEGPIKVVEEQDSGSENGAAMQIDHKIYEDIFGNKKNVERQENTKVRNAPEPALPPKVVATKTPAPAPIVAAQPTTKPIDPKANQKIIVYENGQKPAETSKDLLTKTDGEKRDNTAAPARKPLEKKLAVRVQVAAMTSEDAAQENWKRLNRLYPSLFSGLKSYVAKVDLGKKGIFYRLQIGTFYNQIEAEEFCNRYVTQSQKSRADCIVVE